MPFDPTRAKPFNPSSAKPVGFNPATAKPFNPMSAKPIEEGVSPEDFMSAMQKKSAEIEKQQAELRGEANTPTSQQDIAEGLYGFVKPAVEPIVRGVKQAGKGLANVALYSPRSPLSPLMKPVKGVDQSKEALRGVVDLATGSLTAAIGTIPGMAGVNMITPAGHAVIEQSLKKADVSKDKADIVKEIFNYGVAAKGFGIPIAVGMGAGKFAGWIAQQGIDNIDSWNKLEQQDKDRIVELAHNVGFFAGAIGAGKIGATKTAQNIQNKVGEAYSYISPVKPEDAGYVAPNPNITKGRSSTLNIIGELPEKASPSPQFTAKSNEVLGRIQNEPVTPGEILATPGGQADISGKFTPEQRMEASKAVVDLPNVESRLQYVGERISFLTGQRKNSNTEQRKAIKAEVDALIVERQGLVEKANNYKELINEVGQNIAPQRGGLLLQERNPVIPLSPADAFGVNQPKNVDFSVAQPEVLSGSGRKNAILSPEMGAPVSRDQARVEQKVFYPDGTINVNELAAELRIAEEENILHYTINELVREADRRGLQMDLAKAFDEAARMNGRGTPPEAQAGPKPELPPSTPPRTPEPPIFNVDEGRAKVIQDKLDRGMQLNAREIAERGKFEEAGIKFNDQKPPSGGSPAFNPESAKPIEQSPQEVKPDFAKEAEALGAVFQGENKGRGGVVHSREYKIVNPDSPAVNANITVKEGENLADRIKAKEAEFAKPAEVKPEAPKEPVINKEKIAQDVFVTNEHLRNNKRFKGREDLIRQRNDRLSRAGLQLKGGKIFDAETGKEIKQDIARPKDIVEDGIRKEELSQRELDIIDNLGEILDTGKSKAVNKAGMRDIVEDDGKELSQRAQDLINAAKQAEKSGIADVLSRSEGIRDGIPVDQVLLEKRIREAKNVDELSQIANEINGSRVPDQAKIELQDRVDAKQNELQPKKPEPKVDLSGKGNQFNAFAGQNDPAYSAKMPMGSKPLDPNAKGIEGTPLGDASKPRGDDNQGNMFTILGGGLMLANQANILGLDDDTKKKLDFVFGTMLLGGVGMALGKMKSKSIKAVEEATAEAQKLYVEGKLKSSDVGAFIRAKLGSSVDPVDAKAGARVAKEVEDAIRKEHNPSQEIRDNIEAGIKEKLLSKDLNPEMQKALMKISMENKEANIPGQNRIYLMDKITGMRRYYGAGGTEQQIRLLSGDIERRDILNYGNERLNIIKDVYKDLDKYGRKGLSTAVVNALQDRKNSEKYLDTQEKKVVYNNALAIFEYFKGLLREKGYKVLEEDYYTHIANIDKIDQIFEGEELKTLDKPLDQFINEKSPYLKPRYDIVEDINKDLPSVLTSYMRSVSKEIAYKDAVEYYRGDFRKDIPVDMRKRNMDLAFHNMQNSLTPKFSQGWIMKKLDQGRSNQFTAYLSYGAKQSMLNATQATLSELYITPKALKVAHQVLDMKADHSGSNFASILYQADKMTPKQRKDLIMLSDDLSVEKVSKFKEKFREHDWFTYWESRNWKISAHNGVINAVVNDPRWNATVEKNGGNVLMAVNELLEDKALASKALREADVISAKTQVSPMPASRAPINDHPAMRIMMGFKNFKFRYIQVLVDVLKPMHGVGGVRAMKILDRGIHGDIVPVEILRVVEENRKALEQEIKYAKKIGHIWKLQNGEEIPVDFANKMLDFLKKSEKDANEMVGGIEPLKKSHMLRTFAKYHAMVSGVSMVFQFLGSIADESAYKLTGGWFGKEIDEESLVADMLLGATMDQSPMPFYRFDVPGLFLPALLPSFRNIGASAIYNKGIPAKRAVAKDFIPYALNTIIPGAGLIDRWTGRNISKGLTNLVAPVESKTRGGTSLEMLGR